MAELLHFVRIMTAALKALACLITVWAIVTILYVASIVFFASPKHMGGISVDVSGLTRSPLYWAILVACTLSSLYLVFSRR